MKIRAERERERQNKAAVRKRRQITFTDHNWETDELYKACQWSCTDILDTGHLVLFVRPMPLMNYTKISNFKQCCMWKCCRWMIKGAMMFFPPGGESKKRRWRGQEEGRRWCQEEDDSVQLEFHWIQGDDFIIIVVFNFISLIRGTQHTVCTSPHVSSSWPTDTDWAKETNGKRKEEEDPKWSTQRVKYWSNERGQTQVT